MKVDLRRYGREVRATLRTGGVSAMKNAVGNFFTHSPAAEDKGKVEDRRRERSPRGSASRESTVDGADKVGNLCVDSCH